MTLEFELEKGVRTDNLAENYLPYVLERWLKVNSATNAEIVNPMNVEPNDGSENVRIPELAGTQVASEKDRRLHYFYPNKFPLPDSSDWKRSIPNNSMLRKIPKNKDNVQRTTIFLDTGIAFWNKQFRDKISAMVFIGLESGARLLNKGDLIKYAEMADEQGQNDVYVALGKEFPESVFPLLRSDQMSHGTMVADFLTRENAINPVSLIGVELPANVLLDRTGGLLQALIMKSIVWAVKNFSQEISNQKKIRIVLPYGFIGGPNDVGHPIFQILSNLEDNFEIFIPTGNHRQSQQHAEIPALEARHESLPLTWRVPFDDHSSNTIEMVCKRGENPEFTLRSPDGSHATVILKPETFATLKYNGKLIGAILVRNLGNDRLRIRLTLAPTASTKPDKLAPYGDWTIRVKAGDKDFGGLDLWILRDDTPSFKTGALPDRASQFVDPYYERRGKDNGWHLYDQEESYVKRAGTASVISSNPAKPFVTVSAKHKRFETEDATDSIYSGLPMTANGRVTTSEIVDTGFSTAGREVFGNGSDQRFRVAGTSVACAIAAARDESYFVD